VGLGIPWSETDMNLFYATTMIKVGNALSATFKGWMVEKEESIAKIEEKKRLKKVATCAIFFDLAKRAIEVEESLAKAKAMKAEAKLLAEERDHVY
jgi:hypothetical protein